MQKTEREIRIESIREFVDGKYEFHYPNLRSLSRQVIEVLPDEVIPYVANELMERAGDFFDELRDWKELNPHHLWMRYYGDEE